MACCDVDTALRACADGDSLQATLRRNLGKVCTIHVPGEPSPLGVKGVLSEVGPRICKLVSINDISNPKSAGGEEKRRIHTIPLDKITYVDTAQY